ncbi:hypothetical protein MASR2M70_17530 [Bacillota bacterium]
MRNEIELVKPDRKITRAEFAAIIVRTLGLKPGTGKVSFEDVKDTDWYSSYVKTAAEYKLISGYGNGKFGPNDRVNREQAMAMVARAMELTNLKVELQDGELKTYLNSYADADKAALYARESIAVCIRAGIVTGRAGKLIAPKEHITRAEIAVIVRNLLQKSDLI